MTSTSHKPCYGTMFPHGQPRYHIDGKVFKLHQVGSIGVAARSRVVDTDLAEWDDCRACEEFEHCYQLCMAKIALDTIVNSE